MEVGKNSVFYVSSAIGNDAFLGTDYQLHGENGPFQTLARAVKAVETYRKAGVKKPLRIELLDDQYITEPIQVEKEASLLTIAPFGRRKVGIFGGFRVENWKKDTFNGVECVSAKLPEKANGEKWDFTDFWVNGKRADVTRYPKQGKLKILETEPCDYSTVFGHVKWFRVDPALLEGVEGIENATVNHFHHWIDEHSPVENYDKESGKITLKYLTRFTISADYEHSAWTSMTFYLSGIPSTFEKENEWYLDREKGVVYYIPAFGENQENLVGYVPCTGKIFEIFADDVRLVDLEIAYTRGEYESKWDHNKPNVWEKGETIYGADIQSVCWAHGAITFQGVARSGVKNCYLHALGVHAIDILEGSSDIRIENNVIEDIGAGGVKVDGGAYGCKEEERTHHCVIRGNTIRNIGLKFSAGCGVLVKHASNNEIAENEIYDMDYTGISVGWVWGYAPSNTFGNLIRGNHIHSTRGNLSDLGGIYLLGKQRGTIVSENRIHDIYCNTYGGWGIYLDEGSQEVLVENNVIFNTQLESVHQHYGANNVVRNNVLVGAGYAAAYFGVVGVPTHENTGFSLENNVILIHGMPIYQSSEDEYTARNVIWDTKKQPLKVYLHGGAQVDFEEYIKDGKEIGSVVADPLFENAEAFDFTLKENSPAYEIGFHPLTGFLASGKKIEK